MRWIVCVFVMAVDREKCVQWRMCTVENSVKVAEKFQHYLLCCIRRRAVADMSESERNVIGAVFGRIGLFDRVAPSSGSRSVAATGGHGSAAVACLSSVCLSTGGCFYYVYYATLWPWRCACVRVVSRISWLWFWAARSALRSCLYNWACCDCATASAGASPRAGASFSE